jgi:hypothetical protein
VALIMSFIANLGRWVAGLELTQKWLY